MRRNYRVSWFHVLQYLWLFFFGARVFFSTASNLCGVSTQVGVPCWFHHVARTFARQYRMDVHPKNGSVVSVHMLKYVTLDLIGYNIYIYTYIFIYIHLFFCWARLRSGARPADVENCRRYHSLFQGESADLLKKPEATRIFRTEKTTGRGDPLVMFVALEPHWKYSYKMLEV